MQMSCLRRHLHSKELGFGHVAFGQPTRYPVNLYVYFCLELFV